MPEAKAASQTGSAIDATGAAPTAGDGPINPGKLAAIERKRGRAPQASNITRSLRVADVAATLGCGVSTVWQWSASLDGFPRPRKLSPRVTVWSEQEVLAWLNRPLTDRRGA